MHASTAHPKGLGALAQKNPNPRASPLFPFRSRTSSSSCWRERATWRARARHLLKPRWLLALATRACVRPPKFRRPPRGKAEPADDGDRWRGGLHRQGHTPTWALPPTPESARQRPKRARRGQHVARDVTFASGSVRFHSIPLCDGPGARPFGCQPGRANQPHGGRIGSNRTRRMHGMWGAWWGASPAVGGWIALTARLASMATLHRSFGGCLSSRLFPFLISAHGLITLFRTTPM